MATIKELFDWLLSKFLDFSMDIVEGMLQIIKFLLCLFLSFGSCLVNPSLEFAHLLRSFLMDGLRILQDSV